MIRKTSVTTDRYNRLRNSFCIEEDSQDIEDS